MIERARLIIPLGVVAMRIRISFNVKDMPAAMLNRGYRSVFDAGLEL
jgi:hypothetical protein